jgi:hypothetical protein
VLTQFGARHAITAAAVVRVEVFDRPQRRPQVGCRRRQILTHERHDRLRRLAAQRRRRLDCHIGIVRQDDPFQLDHIGPTAPRGTAKLAERLEDGAISRQAHLAGANAAGLSGLRNSAIAQGSDGESGPED